MAKRAMGIRLIDGNTGNADLDRVYNTIGNLTRQAGLPMPEVGIYDSPEVNAFATGPSRAGAWWRCPRACCGRWTRARSRACSATRSPTSRTATW